MDYPNCVVKYYEWQFRLYSYISFTDKCVSTNSWKNLYWGINILQQKSIYLGIYNATNLLLMKDLGNYRRKINNLNFIMIDTFKEKPLKYNSVNVIVD